MIYAFFVVDNRTAVFLVIAAVGFAYGVFALTAPAIHALRLTRAIRRGLVTSAMVVTAERVGGDICGDLDAGHPKGAFRSSFQEDLEVAAGVTVGSTVEVLVHPTEQRILYFIRPRSEA